MLWRNNSNWIHIGFLNKENSSKSKRCLTRGSVNDSESKMAENRRENKDLFKKSTSTEAQLMPTHIIN